jgi:hypothetical protein
VDNNKYPNYAFQILGGEEWFATTSSAVADTVTVKVNAASVTGKEPYEISLILIVVQGTNLAFGLNTPCTSSGWGQVISCTITTAGPGLIIGNEEALNGICYGPNFNRAISRGGFVQDIGAEYLYNSYQQTNLPVTFNQDCGDTDINSGSNIWAMTAEVVT